MSFRGPPHPAPTQARYSYSEHPCCFHGEVVRRAVAHSTRAATSTHVRSCPCGVPVSCRRASLAETPCEKHVSTVELGRVPRYLASSLLAVADLFCEGLDDGLKCRVFPEEVGSQAHSLGPDVVVRVVREAQDAGDAHTSRRRLVENQILQRHETFRRKQPNVVSERATKAGKNKSRRRERTHHTDARRSSNPVAQAAPADCTHNSVTLWLSSVAVFPTELLAR